MFGPFERMVAFRYLRARKEERFVSVIGIFSLVGIALGVATLIIVMSVMNGFRQELLGRILGLNGHLGVYAADRGNFAIRSRYDALSPAMLRVLAMIADTCAAAGKPVSVCGEMAGQPLEAMVLLALGYKTLSVPAQSIENIKVMVPTVDTTVLRPYLSRLMDSREHSLRERLQSFARDHNITITQED